MGGVIDWKLATTIAEGVAATGPQGDPRPFEEPSAAAEESERLVRAYTGLEPADALPATEAVTRPGWISTNLTSLRSVLDPATERLGAGLGPLRGPVGVAAGTVLAVEVGVLSGFLSQRVLGQYDFPVLDPAAPARLLLVAPNLAHAARTLRAEPDELLRWVALHESTHALQFGAVPWLREHLAAMVRELLTSVQVDPRGLRLPDLRDLRSLVDNVRENGVTALVAGPEQRQQLDRLQAFMAVLEGYAEHVMDEVGAQILPRIDYMRAAMDRRRRDRSGLLRLVEKLLGFDVKLRQYEQGKAFCDAVVADGGIELLNRVWDAPHALPRLDELAAPRDWAARVAPAAA